MSVLLWSQLTVAIQNVTSTDSQPPPAVSPHRKSWQQFGIHHASSMRPQHCSALRLTTIDFHCFSILKYATVKFTNMMDCSTPPLLLRNNILHSTTYCWLEILFNIKIKQSMREVHALSRFFPSVLEMLVSISFWPLVSPKIIPALARML